MRRDHSQRGAQHPPPLLLLRYAVFLLLTLLIATNTVDASGVFELQILEFRNSQSRLRSGACCGGGSAVGQGVCSTPCRTRFALCLKEYQSSATPGGCSFGRAASPALGSDTFTLVEPLYTLALPFTFRWTRSFTLILQAYDDYNYTDNEESGLIAEVWWSGIVEPSAAWHALRGLDEDPSHHRDPPSVAYRVRVLCQPNYYNSTCTTFCRPRDDQFGHYACSPQGLKQCLSGWRGDNCDIPVCKEGCHQTHGRCDKPGDCDCRPGWRGPLCELCTPYPGCKHGYCNGSAWDCTCDTNWGGILCDQDLNYCGTHEPCHNGGTCENTAPDQFLCTCAEGFTGAECEQAEHACAPQPCGHGECALVDEAPGYVCTCREGWTGERCQVDIDECASSPCRHGATCRDLEASYECDCAPGWSGPNCVDDVDECALGPPLGPCANARSCLNSPGSFQCECLVGWAGNTCAHNIDDCAGQCLNGATCIDLVNDYHCACAPGWAGRRCERDIDDCLSRPCKHGGECVDQLDAYRCICPVGFSGHDCEDDRDHCAEGPCDNGAACYTAQSDYYCHCAPGWTGKNCSQPAAVCGAGALSTAPPCVCRVGWTGPVCDIQIDECASSPCLNGGSCVDGVGEYTCLCKERWTGNRCELPMTSAVRCGRGGRCESSSAPPATPSSPCGFCPRGGACRLDPEKEAYRCVCPAPDHPDSRPCLEELAGLEEVEENESAWFPSNADSESSSEMTSTSGCSHGGTWWWGCNVCACAGGAASCTRVWCGIEDCLGSGAVECRADEVCVPAARVLCLRGPCASPGECRRVSGRRVEPPPLPAPSGCWPGRAPSALEGCARARLQLAHERLSPGAHVEFACTALRRALAVALAPRVTPLVLLCDLPSLDRDSLDIAIWVDPESGEAGATMLTLAVRALHDLVSKRRLAQHPLLGAALRIHATLPEPQPVAAPSAALPASLAVVAILALVAVALFFIWRRRRRSLASSLHHDEEKSNNLQNEENLRRYANPIRGNEAEPAVGSSSAASAPSEVPHALYKASNADARNTAPPRTLDKEFPKRALPPERLTVLV